MKTVAQYVTVFGYPLIGALFSLSVAASQAQAQDTPAPAASHHAMAARERPTSDLVRVVRRATERFRDVTVAEKEGFVLQFGCVTGSEAGAMGMHFVNFPLVTDGVIDATRPEIVIYEPLPGGRLRLIGADYIVLADAWDATHSGPPELMGQLFHLFEAPNRFGLPRFYTLHVWAWKDNPSGTFTNWHSNVSCDAFSGRDQ
jgi:hypothetical protein